MNELELLQKEVQEMRNMLSLLIYSDRYTFHKKVQVLDGRNFQFGKTTGTKFGTETSQLMGFWNVTPVNQPDSVANANTQNVAGSDTVDENKIEADLTSCKTAINLLIDRLEELGLIST